MLFFPLAALRYLGHLVSPAYPEPYDLEPQTIVHEVSAFENERIIYVASTVSINPEDTLTITGGEDGATACGANCIKRYTGLLDHSLISDVAFTPTNQTSSSFTIVRKPSPDGVNRQGFYIDLYGTQFYAVL